MVVIFFVKSQSKFENQVSGNGLVTGNETLGELVGKSATGDGIPDWEKILYGLDPTKKENVPGVPDSVTIAKLEEERKTSAGVADNGAGATDQQNNPPTQTDQFSKELFSSVVALNQAGTVDQNTVDTLSNSLSNQIKNSAIKKIYLLSDLKTVPDTSKAVVQQYISDMSDINKKYPENGTVIEVLSEFSNNGGTPNTDALKKLTPIAERAGLIIQAMVSIDVPSDLAQLHLDVVNGLERLMENTNDIELYDTDSVVALAAISKYESNASAFSDALTKLDTAIQQKLST